MEEIVRWNLALGDGIVSGAIESLVRVRHVERVRGRQPAILASFSWERALDVKDLSTSHKPDGFKDRW